MFAPHHGVCKLPLICCAAFLLSPLAACQGDWNFRPPPRAPYPSDWAVRKTGLPSDCPEIAGVYENIGEHTSAPAFECQKSSNSRYKDDRNIQSDDCKLLGYNLLVKKFSSESQGSPKRYLIRDATHVQITQSDNSLLVVLWGKNYKDEAVELESQMLSRKTGDYTCASGTLTIAGYSRVVFLIAAGALVTSNRTFSKGEDGALVVNLESHGIGYWMAVPLRIDPTNTWVRWLPAPLP